MSSSKRSSVSSQSSNNSVENLNALYNGTTFSQKDLREYSAKVFRENCDSKGFVEKIEIDTVLIQICEKFKIVVPSKEQLESFIVQYSSCFEKLICFEEFWHFLEDVFKITEEQELISKNNIFQKKLSKKDIELKQMQMTFKRSSKLNEDLFEFNKHIDMINDGINVEKQQLLTTWQKMNQEKQRSRRQTQVQYESRIVTDQRYMTNHIVKKTGSITSVYTEISPKTPIVQKK